MTHLTPDGEQKSMPLKVLKSKKDLTGKEQALHTVPDRDDQLNPGRDRAGMTLNPTRTRTGTGMT